MLRSLPLLLILAVPTLADPLPKTTALTREGDLSAQMVAGIDTYLTKLREETEKSRPALKLDLPSPARDVSAEAFDRSAAPAREKLRKILGVVDTRVSFQDLELVGTVGTPALIAETERYKVYTVRWPVLPGVDGEGLLLEPTGKVVAQVVALPDADQTPEQLVGLQPGVAPGSQFARHLASFGCRVVVPTLIDRRDDLSGSAAMNRWTNQPHREFIYRMAYEMGRHILGYEVQKVLAVVDWFAREKGAPTIGVAGYGEGGLVALYSGALDSRIKATLVSGAIYPKDQPPTWQQPIYRNVWQLERDFSLVDLLQLCRHVTVEESLAPQIDGPPPQRDNPTRRGAAPGAITTPAEVRAALEKLPPGQGEVRHIAEPGVVVVRTHAGAFGHLMALQGFMIHLGGPPPRSVEADPPKDRRSAPNPTARHDRQFRQLVDFTQKIMRDSEAVRARTFWNTLKVNSLDDYAKSTEPQRQRLGEVLGMLPAPTMPMNPKSRQIYDEPKWTGYEVTLDVYPDVYAYGILLLPKDLKPGEKRPVIVCQHGLEGKPVDVVNPKMKTPYYASFGAALADKGYIVFAPQNPYIGHDKFRVLQRKGNPLGLSLFSFIIRQHERILDWLATLPNVDADHLAFYGLSYGGKTAMRVPAMVPRYCLSICSGDFNEWIWKNVSVDFPASYMFSPEYEMPEFNLGNTFNYAEMAALIAPRPFMVERGHDDGVGIDEWVAYEFAKVRRLYSRLKLPERTTIEFFAGGHEIKLIGTGKFLEQHVPLPK
jgi:dienelactone hydrolase